MRRVLTLLLTLIWTLSLSLAAAEIAPMPLDALPPPPQEAGYISDTHYEDPSITVDVYYGGRIHDTDYVYAVIRVADASQVRTAMAYRYGSGYTKPGTDIARANNAVFALNGDYYSFYSYGYLVRQGVTYRERPHKEWDVLMIDQNGDFHTIERPSKAKIADWQAENPELTVINSFNFGPVLVKDGVWHEGGMKTVENYFQIAGHREYARLAIAQLDTLTYLVVSGESVLDVNSDGMTLDDWLDCLKEVEGKLDGYTIREAYNMDGGGSATVVFRDEKINSPTNPKIRDLSDIIYFASACTSSAE